MQRINTSQFSQHQFPCVNRLIYGIRVSNYLVTDNLPNEEIQKNYQNERSALRKGADRIATNVLEVPNQPQAPAGALATVGDFAIE